MRWIGLFATLLFVALAPNARVRYDRFDNAG